MGKRIGFWTVDRSSMHDYTLVSHENYDYFLMFLEDNKIENCVSFKLTANVTRNPEIFAWYLTTQVQEEPELDFNCCNSQSGHLICLLKEFIQAFNNLDLETCQRLQKVFSSITFQDHYLFRTEWILGELINFLSVLREALLEISPFDCNSQLSYRLWWNQPLQAKRLSQKFQMSCDLSALEKIQTLQPLTNLYKNVTKALGQWDALRGLEKLEAASGYFLSLAEYWFKIKHYQVSLLCIHRSIDCALLLLGYREQQIFATSDGLRDDQGKYVTYASTFQALKQRSNIVFDPSENKFISNLNDCRNYLRETHGFRVVNSQEVSSFLTSACNLLKNLQPEVRAYSYKEKFNIDLKIPLRLIFEIELAIDSYMSEI
jgi:hypothetical protein